MIKFSLLLLFAWLQALPAWAVNAPDYPAELATANFNSAGTRTTGQAACDLAAAAGMAGGSFSSYRYYLSGAANIEVSHKCDATWKSNGSITSFNRTITFKCSYGGTLSGNGGSYMCVNVPAGGGPPPDCTDKNPMIRQYAYGPTGPYVSPDHFGSCKVTPLEMLACGKTATGSYCFWKIARTGEVYTGPDNSTTGSGSSNDSQTPPSGSTPAPSPPLKPPPPATPDICSTCVPCPKGTVQAGISADGIPMCVGTGTNPPPAPVPPPTTTKPPTTTTGSDGTTTTKQDTVQTNSDGSTTTTTTTTTTAPDGTKTVTVAANTTNGTSGSPGKTDAPQDDKYNLCKQNPTLSICRESSISGTCGQITCTGDAIQCATLRAAAAMECKQRTDEDALKALSIHGKGQAAANGADPDAATLPSVKNASVVEMGTMDTSGWMGGGAAFSDVSFTVQGKSFTVPLEKWTGYLVGLRYALMVVAMLVSFRMLSGVILRD